MSRFRSFLLLVITASTWICPAVGAPDRFLPSPTSVQIEPLTPAYPEGADPEAIQLACAAGERELAAFFRDESLPFEPDLLRRSRGKVCHVFYRPTLPGFHADLENLPVTELFVDVDTISFLARRSRVVGDSLDIAKAILSQVRRPIHLTLGLKDNDDEKWLAQAQAFHFAGTHHLVTRRRSRAPMSNPWVQDYLKSGTFEGGKRILVTRMLYEGDAAYGDVFKPMLDELGEARFVRSRIAWEGGDILFARDPKAPKQTLLLAGDAAKKYWGTDLSMAEYTYVLRLEFGADRALDLSGLAPHVDYFATVLPYENLILAAVPTTGRPQLGLEAIRLLTTELETSDPAGLQRLLNAYSRLAESAAEPDDSIREQLDIARAFQWSIREDPELWERLTQYVAEHCADQVQDCLGSERRAHLLETDPTLLERWVSEALKQRTELHLPPLMLALADSQLRGSKPPRLGSSDAAIRRLEDAGFQVKTIPRLLPADVPWAGVSYANSLLIDRTLFLPTFGLGEAEDELIAEIRETLRNRYDVVPIYARHNLIHNGGLHCTFGVIRGVPPELSRHPAQTEVDQAE